MTDFAEHAENIGIKNVIQLTESFKENSSYNNSISITINTSIYI